MTTPYLQLSSAQTKDGSTGGRETVGVFFFWLLCGEGVFTAGLRLAVYWVVDPRWS